MRRSRDALVPSQGNLARGSLALALRVAQGAPLRFASKTAVLPFCRTLKARWGRPDFESSAFDHSGAAASGARVIALVPVE